MMYDKIMQEITKGRNLVIDNEKLAEPVDSIQLFDEINRVFMLASIDMREAIQCLESDAEFAKHIVRRLSDAFGVCLVENETYEMSDIEDIIREIVIEKKNNPVFIITSAEAGIGHDLYYDLIAIIQGMFQANMMCEENNGFQSVIIIGKHIIDDLLREHEYGHVYRKPWVSGELYNQL